MDQVTALIQQKPELVAVVGIALLVLVIALVTWRLRRGNHDMRQFYRVLKPFALDKKNNVFVPDPVEGHIWIDQLVLTQGGILVIDVRRYEGHLFGGEHVNDWTQLIGMKRGTFSNPLEKMPQRVQAVRAIVPGIPVEGRVVFTCLGDFPKGIPGGVSVCDSLARDLEAFFASRIDADRLNQAWQVLLEQLEPATGSH